MADGAVSAVTRDFAKGMEVVHQAAFAGLRPVDRNDRVRAVRGALMNCITALEKLANLKFSSIEVNLADEDPAHVEEARRSAEEALTTLRDGQAMLERELAPLTALARRNAPDLIPALRRTCDAAIESTVALRIGVALSLGDREELDALGYEPTEQPPVGTRGPLVPLDELLRDLPS
jgi:hypothetical protein